MIHSARPTGTPGVAPPRTVVAIGASLGGIAALRRVLGGLPADFPAAVLVVQHADPRAPSRLAGALAAATPLQVRAAAEGERMREGVVYVAPPDRHLRVDAAGALRLTDEPLVNFVRPAADVLFASLADEFAAGWWRWCSRAAAATARTAWRASAGAAAWSLPRTPPGPWPPGCRRAASAPGR